MTHFSYVDIGTSDFGTSLKQRKPGDIILLVEPISFYLDRLPSGDNIIKFNAAVSNKNGISKVFYVSLDNIEKYKLPAWIRGCNSIDEKHPTVLKILKEKNLSENLIESKDIEIISFDSLIDRFSIGSIYQLKIDTEGHDHIILKNVLDYINLKSIKINKIIFEYEPDFKNTNELDEILENFIKIGYKYAGFYKNNKILEL